MKILILFAIIIVIILMLFHVGKCHHCGRWHWGRWHGCHQFGYGGRCKYCGHHRKCAHLNYTIEENLINPTRKVTLHYVNWCAYCKLMKPIWDRVKASTIGNNIIFEEVDEDVAKTPEIKSYPTILMIDERGRVYSYVGGPDFDTLKDWVLAIEH
jgi:thioredoxin-related protein